MYTFISSVCFSYIVTEAESKCPPLKPGQGLDYLDQLSDGRGLRALPLPSRSGPGIHCLINSRQNLETSTNAIIHFTDENIEAEHS